MAVAAQLPGDDTDDGVIVRLPDGPWRSADTVDEVLSQLLGREVAMSDRRSAGTTVERPDPELVLSEGLDADIEPAELEIAQGAPGGRFVDHSPLHLITTATLDEIGVQALRYRPNIVMTTPQRLPTVRREHLDRAHAPHRDRRAAGNPADTPLLRAHT